MFVFDQNHECLKVGTPQECQLACKQTSGCSKFSYFTKYFKNSNDVKNVANREPLECCLLTDTDAEDKVTKKQYVVSGPKFCSNTDSPPSKNTIRDVFSGKRIKCKHIL